MSAVIPFPRSPGRRPHERDDDFWQDIADLAYALDGGRSLRGLELLEGFLRQHREPAPSDFERHAVRRLILTIALNAGGRP
jgi:hypothetical protein